MGRLGSSRSLPRQSSRSLPRQLSGLSFTTTSSSCSILHDAPGTLDHTSIVTVSQLWNKVKLAENYKEELPEQCILRMLELDPETRKHLRLPSLRSPRFDQISKTILYIIDTIVSILGPDLEDFVEELFAIGELCSQEGINPRLLGESTTAGLAHILTDFKPEKKQAWKSTFDFLATKMNGGLP
jgi:hypothetical protein